MSDLADAEIDDDFDDLEPLDPLEDHRPPGWLMVVGGLLGLWGAFILTVDKVNLLQDKVDGKTQNLVCDLNAFVSCSGVMQSEQSHAFGFPNSLLGIIGFTIVITLGVLVLARVALPAFVWLGLQLGTIFGICFVTWLQFQSIHVIEKLCPYCMLVWTVMIATFVYVTAANLRRFVPGNPVTRFVSNWTLLITLLWYVVVAGAIWAHFGSRLWA